MAHAHAGKGLLLLQARDYPQALEAGEHALLIQPDEPTAVLARTATLFTMNQYRAGLAGCGQASWDIERTLFKRFWPIRWR